jgi:hypothetical protein
MTNKRVIEVLEDCKDRIATWRDYARLSRNWDPKADEPYYADRIEAIELAIVAVKHYAKEAAK